MSTHNNETFHGDELRAARSWCHGAMLAAVLVWLAPSMAAASHANPLLIGGPQHPPLRSAAHALQAPAGAFLTYYGGRVVSNLQVVQVLYGTGQYLPNVSSVTSPSMATFYQGVLNSPYVDWLTEYNTDIPAAGGGPGTTQTIGRGSFVGQYTITPSPQNSGSPIDDTQVQAELAAQIQAGHLPAPTSDALGNNNTYYAVFFPHGVTVTLGGSASCVLFCAYHGTIADVGGHEVYYGVHPDMEDGSGCEFGCGNGAPFENYTSVASHEMIETITDPEVGLATILAPPLAWYDGTYGEIGDICNAEHDTIIGADAVTYTVQTEWSNRANACIAHGTLPVSAGTISLERTPYSCASSVGVNVADSDLRGTGTMSVVVTTSGGDSETVSLTETPPMAAIFVGTIATQAAAPTVEDGVLEVSDGETITATYSDADDGTGHPATVQATAAVDCTAPVISNVLTTAVSGAHATVTFDTNELTTPRIRYGLSCSSLTQTQSGSATATSHVVELSDLVSTTQYFYGVDATDIAGNVTTDTNGGSCYSFTTLQRADFFTEIFDAEDNDVRHQTLTFTPDGSASFYSVCRSSAPSFPTDPTGGQALTIGDDDFVQVDLSDGAQVSLYGVAYKTFFVGSNGYITFTDGDYSFNAELDTHFTLPRIAPLFDDLDPTAGGRISWKQLPDRVAVTFSDVHEFSTRNSNNFQVELFFNGTIRMTHLRIDATDALVGLSQGLGTPVDFAESDMNAYAFCTDFIPGGGLQQSDCVHEWYSMVNTNRRDRIPVRRIECTDDDPGCDVGGVAGDKACTFRVSLCLNRTDLRLPCTPTDVRQVDLSQPGVKPRDAAGLANRAALEAALTGLGGHVQGQCANSGASHLHFCDANAQCDTAPGSGDGRCRRTVVFAPPLAAPNSCSAPAEIRVPLRGPRFAKGVERLRLSASRSDQSRVDTDALTLICHPRR